MTDGGKCSFILGIEVVDNADAVLLSQARYINDILERFGMHKTANPLQVQLDISMKLVSSDAMTKLDAPFRGLGRTHARDIDSPGYCVAVHTVTLHGEPASKDIDFQGYSDADWAGDLSDRKSTSGYLFKSPADRSLGFKKQSSVSLSTSEAEYIALSLAIQKAWVQACYAIVKKGYALASTTSVKQWEL
ncbi:Integrase catalytic core protein [Phytophthora cinnamomi]|uniref:Integrase catalytic core protein n=1 Tax=Phytophthora cinnamomi TaxID=4785 RepID=UPI0035593B83|nr:Integrase catalytic core protein [Phytophthora cinnamomi]